MTMRADPMVLPINMRVAGPRKCQRRKLIPIVEFMTAVYPRKWSSGVLCF